MRTYDNYEYNFDLINQNPAANLGNVVVIPAYDEPNILDTITSLIKADALQKVGVEVIVVVNDAESSAPTIVKQNDQSFRELQDYAKLLAANSSLRLHPIRVRDLSGKEAGVGLARKIGMDEAVKRLARINKIEGIICCLDADVRVDANYFSAIWEAYTADPKLRAATLYFEHDLDEEGIGEEAKRAIVEYESHLRYHIRMQRLVGLPFAYHTVGSTMTVRASAYLAHFGMNKRKAGEDFYFLHKFIKSGFYREIIESTVYPSARFSNRVPFGTGKMVEKLSDSSQTLKTYHYQNYLDLQKDLEVIWHYYYEGEQILQHVSGPFCEFVGEKLLSKLTEFKKHSSHKDSFKKRFFQWFDAFMLIKYLHFMRDHQRGNIPVDEALCFLFKEMKCLDPKDPVIRLEAMREWDRKNNFNRYLLMSSK